MHLLLPLLLVFANTPLTAQQAHTIRVLEESLVGPCCYSQPIATHLSADSEEMRNEITQMVTNGMTEQEILARYKAIYDERILSVPDGFSGMIVFVTPLAAFVASFNGLLFVLRRVAKTSRAAATTTASIGAYANRQVLLQRIRMEVEEGF